MILKNYLKFCLMVSVLISTTKLHKTNVKKISLLYDIYNKITTFRLFTFFLKVKKNQFNFVINNTFLKLKGVYNILSFYHYDLFYSKTFFKKFVRFFIFHLILFCLNFNCIFNFQFFVVFEGYIQNPPVIKIHAIKIHPVKFENRLLIKGKG